MSFGLNESGYDFTAVEIFAFDEEHLPFDDEDNVVRLSVSPLASALLSQALKTAIAIATHKINRCEAKKFLPTRFISFTKIVF